jgi:hypothetical protein
VKVIHLTILPISITKCCSFSKTLPGHSRLNKTIIYEHSTQSSQISTSQKKRNSRIPHEQPL